MRTRRPPMTPEEAQTIYDLHHTCAECALVLGWPMQTVWSRFKKLGVKMQPSGKTGVKNFSKKFEPVPQGQTKHDPGRRQCVEGRTWKSKVIQCCDGMQCQVCTRGEAHAIVEVTNRRSTTLERAREMGVESVVLEND